MRRGRASVFAAAWSLAACGRFGFGADAGAFGGDGLGGDGLGGDGLGSDTGIVPSDASGPLHQITNFPGRSDHPGIVQTASGLAVAWDDDRDGNREIYLALLAPDGTPVTTDIRITNDLGDSTAPDLAWTGTELGVVWQDDRTGTPELFFQRVASTGTLIGSATQITTDAAGVREPSLVWTGTEYGLVRDSLQGANDSVVFQSISATGAPGATRVVNSSSAAAYGGRLAWTGTDYGVAWVDSRDGFAAVYFVRLDTAGARIGTELNVSGGAGDRATIAWSGTTYAIAWLDSNVNPTLWVSRVDGMGASVGTANQLASGSITNPWITGGANAWGITWAENVATGDVAAFVARLDSAGAPLSQPMRVSPTPSAVCCGARVTATATDYAIAYPDFDADSVEIFAALFPP